MAFYDLSAARLAAMFFSLTGKQLNFDSLETLLNASVENLKNSKDFPRRYYEERISSRCHIIGKSLEEDDDDTALDENFTVFGDITTYADWLIDWLVADFCFSLLTDAALLGKISKEQRKYVLEQARLLLPNKD